jgi:hypothetical protein
MNLAVIVPWGTDHGPRERVWDFLRPRWERTGADLIVGADPLFAERGTFSVSRAINNAVRLAPPEYDAFALFGADHVPDAAVLDHAARQLAQREWTPLYRRIAYADEVSSRLWLDAAGPDDDLTGTWHEEPQLCPGVLAVRRDLFGRVGGMDERFEGWGYEDTALVDKLTAAAAPGQPSDATLRELWHPTGHRDLNGPNKALYEGTGRG